MCIVCLVFEFKCKQYCSLRVYKSHALKQKRNKRTTLIIIENVIDRNSRNNSNRTISEKLKEKNPFIFAMKHSFAQEGQTLTFKMHIEDNYYFPVCLLSHDKNKTQKINLKSFSTPTEKWNTYNFCHDKWIEFFFPQLIDRISNRFICFESNSNFTDFSLRNVEFLTQSIDSFSIFRK